MGTISNETFNEDISIKKINNIKGKLIYIMFNTIGVSYIGEKLPNTNNLSDCYILEKPNAISMVQGFFNKLKVNKEIKKMIKK